MEFSLSEPSVGYPDEYDLVLLLCPLRLIPPDRDREGDVPE
jgi:hypothetical protein